jgi:uncharacterized protein (DUF488 family)
MSIALYTIGFTKKNAREFFTLLRNAGVKRILDIRLNNQSQLAGFTKRDDLAYFLKELCGADYRHVPEAAPSQEMLDEFKKQKGDWQRYVERFVPLITGRRIEDILIPEILDRACLLCSEPTPAQCHRRLVAEYLGERVSGIEIVHL